MVFYDNGNQVLFGFVIYSHFVFQPLKPAAWRLGRQEILV